MIEMLYTIATVYSTLDKNEETLRIFVRGHAQGYGKRRASPLQILNNKKLPNHSP